MTNLPCSIFIQMGGLLQVNRLMEEDLPDSSPVALRSMPS